MPQPRPPFTRRSSASGFTLIELIVVIVILGVLAATALPKFLDFKTDARIAALNQLAGTLRSTSDMVHAKCLLNGCKPFNNENLTLNGITRVVWFGYPIENSRGNGWWGINDLVNHDGFDYSPSVGNYPRPAYFSVPSAPDPALCRVTYTYSESDTPPTITVTTSGC